MSYPPASDSSRQTSPEDDEIDTDFQDPITLPNSFRKRPHAVDGVDEEQEVKEITLNCSICDGAFNNDRHCPFTLKCGHVFGGSCIKKYIRDMTRMTSSACCFICQEVIKKSHPRRVWATKAIPDDPKIIQSLKSEIQEAKEKVIQLQQKRLILKGEIEQYKYKIDNIDQLSLSQDDIVTSQKQKEKQELKNQFQLKDSVSFKYEVCSLVDINASLNMVAVGCYNHTSNTYGFRKCNLYDLSVTEFFKSGHQKDVLAMKLSGDGMLLSTGLDRTLKLTSLANNQVIQSYCLDSPGYCCSFDNQNPNSVLCGTENGELCIFDLRNTKGYVHKLAVPNSASSKAILSIMPCMNGIVCMDSCSIYMWNKTDESEKDAYNYKKLLSTAVKEFDRDDMLDRHRSKYSKMRFNDGLFCTSEKDTSSSKIHVWHLSEDAADLEYIRDPLSVKETDDIQLFTHDEKGPYICSLADKEIKVFNNACEIVQTLRIADHFADWSCAKAQDDNLLAILQSRELQLYEFV